MTRSDREVNLVNGAANGSAEATRRRAGDGRICGNVGGAGAAYSL